MLQDLINHSALGKTSEYPAAYNDSLLFPIPRALQRPYIKKNAPLPFQGVDIWNAYELSWLNLKGKPIVATAEFIFPCESINIIESKSFKVYLNSYNQSCFESIEAVQNTLKKDLSHASGNNVDVNIILPEFFLQTFINYSGICLDALDVAIEAYEVDANLLSVKPNYVEESLFSHLLKSNCPVTGQPDWATVWIHYAGNQIDHANLLKYIISYRNHQDFHEHCVETMYMDILNKCRPEKISVFAQYTRRGGLDINPFRSNFESYIKKKRQFRQ